MLNKFFRPKWQNSNPEIRCASIEKMTHDDADLLKSIALSDTDATTRGKAFSKIVDIHLILELFTQTDFEEDRHAITLHLVDHIDRHHENQNILSCLLETLKKCELLPSLVLYSTHEHITDQAIVALDSEDHSLNLLRLVKTHALRHKLAHYLHTEEHLKSAFSWSKTKDKTIAKIIKCKLDSLNNKNKQLQQQKEKAEAFLNKLQLLNTNKGTTHLKGELILAHKIWQEISQEDLQPDIVVTITQELQQLTELTDTIEQQKHEEILGKQQEALNHEKKTLWKNNISQLLNAIYQSQGTDLAQLKTDGDNIWHDFTTLSGLPEADISRLQVELDRCFKTIQQQQHIVDSLASFNLSTDKGANKLALKDAGKKLSELTDLLATSKTIIPSSLLLQKLETRTEQLETFVENRRGETKQHIQKLREYVKKAETFIDDKHIKEADKAFQQAKRLSKNLTVKQRNQFSQTFKRIAKSIEELSDWRRFSTTPIRIELCKKMQSLIDTDIEANDKAKTIKQLQEQWQNLGRTEDQSLWQEFQDLSQKAFIPCQQAFDKEKEKRAFNAQQRMHICDEIEHLVEGCDWQTTDFKSLDKLQQKIVNEWKRFSPVERSEHKMLQDRFSKSIDLIKQNIIQHKKQNLAKLESLCEKANVLLQEDDLNTATNNYKTLMESWKSVGLTFRKEQEEKWLNFRSIGNQLHEKNSTVKAVQKEQKNDAIKKTESIINDIQAIANAIKKPSTENINQLQTQFHEHVSHFNKLEELPDRIKNKLTQKFKGACKQYNNALEINKQQEWLVQLALFEKFLDNASTSDTEIFDATFIPDSMNNAWKERFINTYPQHKTSDQHKPTHSRNLCIKMEMLCGKDSPANDTALKMALQMEALKDNFGIKQSDVIVFDEIENLYFLWFGQPIRFLLENRDLTERFLNTAKSFIAQQINLTG